MRKNLKVVIPILVLISCAVQLACGNGTVTQPPTGFDPLYAPRNLEWSVGSERIFLSWDHVPFAEGYRVYLSSNGVDFILYSGSSLVPSNSIVITEVSNSQPYYVGVSAIGGNGVESAISYPGGAPNATPIFPSSVQKDPYRGVKPAPPKNLQGYAGDRFVHLEWEPNTEPDLKDYLVGIRRGTIGTYSIFPAITENEFNHNDAENSVTYFYKVQARDNEQPPLISDDSNIVKYTPKSAPPLEPQGFSGFYAFVENGVQLNWYLPGETDIAKYRIIRYNYTNDEVDPLIDTVVVTLDFPRTKDPYSEDPEAYIFIPPFVDRLIVLKEIYVYELSAIDTEGQIGPPALTDQITIPG